MGGGIKSTSIQKCIESWKELCPGYKIIEWNESNFDISYNDFTKEAYAAKRFAFVSDVARLYALTQMGGVYMDTDVEVIRSIDELLNYKGVTCFQSEANVIATAFLACEKDFPLFKEFLSQYNDFHFLNPDGSCKWVSNNNLITAKLKEYGLVQNNCKQIIKGLVVLPKDYFSPKNPITKELKVTGNTYAIHHFDGSWNFDIKDYKEELRRKYKFLPEKVIKFIAYAKLRGIQVAVRAGTRWLKEMKESKKGKGDIWSNS